MGKQSILLFIALLFFGTAFCQYSPGCFALRDITVIDGRSNNVLSHYTVIICGKHIKAVGPTKEIEIPDSVTIIDGRGKFVMPGLIDSHVHLATEPTVEDNRIRAEKDLKAMLLSGITSVRDMAGDARALGSLSRDAALGQIISPDIYYAALMAGPGFFKDPRTHQSTQGGIAGDMPFMRAVNDTTDLPLAIAEAKGTGATAIKLYAEISGALAKKITAEAHKQHLLVWSHANLDDASTLEVINAGVNSISHAAMVSNWHSRNIPANLLKPGLDDFFWDSVFNTLPVKQLIQAMQAHNTLLDATILTFKEAAAEPSSGSTRRYAWTAMYEIGKRFTMLALKNNIPVSAGTDVDENKFVQREIKMLVNACHFTPMEALISSTRNGAMAIGIEKTTGTLEAQKIANLIVLSANPAENIENLDKVVLVIKNGKLYNGDH